MGKFPINSELLKRFLTAAVLIPVVFWFLLTDKVTLLLLIITTALFGEWIWLLLRQPLTRLMKSLLFLGGSFYMGGALWGLFKFFDFFGKTPYALLYLLLVLWVTDTGAYFVGSTVGGPKLAPRISPKKTWSGAIGGLLSAILLAFSLTAFPFFDFLPEKGSLFLLTVFISVSGQLGDLAESYLKRCLEIKDVSRLLPGHGGLLDRLDSLLGVGFLLALFFLI